MSYNVKTIKVFERQAKRLIKKYPSLKKELAILVSSLKVNPEQGTSLIEEQNVYLLTMYDKSEKEDLSDKELELLLNLLRE